MEGYKGFNYDLTCRGFQYKVGEKFTMDEPISLCERGYHFCTSLSDTFHFYIPNEDNVFCEIEASGEIQKGDGKCVCSEIKIIKKLPKSMVNRARYGNGYGYGYGNGNSYGNSYGYGNGNSYGNSYGCGNGDGNGDGNGYGNGNSYGYGDGYGNGNGYGYGYGDGNGNGNGNGDGYGYGYGYGYGDGYGYGVNIHEIILLK